MAGSGIQDLFGALGGGLSALAGSSSGGGAASGGGVVPDFGATTPANAPNTVFTDPLVGAPAAVTAGDPTGQGQQQPPQPTNAQAPTFTQAPPQQPQPVSYLSPEARDAAIGGAPTSGVPDQTTPVAQPAPTAQSVPGAIPGGSPATATGLTPEAEIAAGYRPPEATDADLAQAAEEQARKQQGPIGASSINTDQQQQQLNPLQTAGQLLKSVARQTPGSREAGGGGAGGGFNIYRALGDFLTKGPGAFAQDLLGLNRQVGGDYETPQATSQGYGQHGYGYGADQPPAQAAVSGPPTQQPSAPQPPSETAPGAAPEAAPEAAPAPQTDMAPGSAAQAIRQGYDRAAAEDRKQQRPIEQEPPRGAIGHNYFQRHGIQPKSNMVTTIQTPYGKVTANKQAVADTQNLMKDLHDAGAPIHKFGSYNVRRMRRGNAWSSHAYGTAFDINDMPAEMAPDIKRWIDQNPQRWHDILAKNNFSQPYPGWDPNHIEWGGPRAGAENRQQTPVAAAATEPQRLFGQPPFPQDFASVYKLASQLAPGGIPWQNWRRSANVEPGSSPFLTPLALTDAPEGAPAATVNDWRAGNQSPNRASLLAAQAGMNDIDPLLYQLARQWAQQTMTGR